MKLGIIGSGMIAQEFLPKLVDMDGVKVMAVQGTSGGALPRQWRGARGVFL